MCGARPGLACRSVRSCRRWPRTCPSDLRPTGSGRFRRRSRCPCHGARRPLRRSGNGGLGARRRRLPGRRSGGGWCCWCLLGGASRRLRGGGGRRRTWCGGWCWCCGCRCRRDLLGGASRRLRCCGGGRRRARCRGGWSGTRRSLGCHLGRRTASDQAASGEAPGRRRSARRGSRFGRDRRGSGGRLFAVRSALLSGRLLRRRFLRRPRGLARWLGCRLLGLHWPTKSLAVRLAAGAVSLRVLDRGRVALHSHPERQAEVERLFVRQAELMCELVDTDLLRQRRLQPFQ